MNGTEEASTASQNRAQDAFGHVVAPHQRRDGPKTDEAPYAHVDPDYRNRPEPQEINCNVPVTAVLARLVTFGGLLMDIKRALPRPNSKRRALVRRESADLGSSVLAWPVAARPHQILNIHLAEPYQVRIDGGPAKTSPEIGVVGPQTYRRAHVHLSGQIHVFNILFQPTGLNRLVGINMTSLVDQDPAASDVLGKSALVLDDAVRRHRTSICASPPSNAGSG